MVFRLRRSAAVPLPAYRLTGHSLVRRPEPADKRQVGDRWTGGRTCDANLGPLGLRSGLLDRHDLDR